MRDRELRICLDIIEARTRQIAQWEGYRYISPGDRAKIWALEVERGWYINQATLISQGITDEVSLFDRCALEAEKKKLLAR